MDSKLSTVFDIHVHLLGNEELDREFLDFAIKNRMRFAVSCLGPDGKMLADPTVSEITRANDLVVELQEDHPHLVHGFCYINPHHGKLSIHEIRRCLDDHYMTGIKLWTACKCSDEIVFPIVEEAISHNTPILQHVWIRRGGNLPGESAPEDIAQLADRYPQANFIMAHFGFRWIEAVDTIKDFPNIYTDTSGTDPELGSIEYAVSKLGTGRVLYGSDAPGRDVLCQIGKVLSADISDEQRKSLLFMNAEALMKGSR